jgi:hypothetical protein
MTTVTENCKSAVIAEFVSNVKINKGKDTAVPVSVMVALGGGFGGTDVYRLSFLFSTPD